MSESRLIVLLKKSKSLTHKWKTFSTHSIESQSIFSPTVKTSSCIGCGLRALLQNNHKSIYKPSSRNFSTAASVSRNNTEGLKLLVIAGPHAQKAVGSWLFVSAACVFSIIVLGGVTRLTRFGFSMTDWKFTASLPPITVDEWLIEFEKYKHSPDYKRINKGMDLDDFKFIYWKEYAHHMWGRALGVTFALPFSYFLSKRYITPRLGLRLSGLLSLGAGQGLIGWWMVKSGLEEPVSEFAEPSASPFRLAAYLTSTLVIYTGLLWTALSVVTPEPPAGSLAWVRGAAKVKRLALPVSILAGITAVSGAFAAGNGDTGDAWVPEDVFNMKPIKRYFFENTSTVQLDHRILATATLFSVGGLWLSTRKLNIHPQVRFLLGCTAVVAVLQVPLGILTLLVPVLLGTADQVGALFHHPEELTLLTQTFLLNHRFGALNLLTLMILLNHTLRRPSLHLLKTLPSVLFGNYSISKCNSFSRF